MTLEILPDESDHLHELEAAVVEAAVLRRYLEVEAMGTTTGAMLDSGLGLRYYQAAEAERKAVDALLAARAAHSPVSS